METEPFQQTSKNKAVVHWIFHIIGAVLLFLFIFFIFTQDNSLPTNPISQETTKPSSLASAVSLLPHPEYVLSGRKMSDAHYWVWSRNMSEGTNPLEQSWVVDVEARTTNLVSERNFGPVGATVSTSESLSGFLEVAWMGGWEGLWTRAQEYYDRTNGELAYALVIHSGQSMEVISPEKTLLINYDPLDLCGEVSSLQNSLTTVATGLNINRQSFPFPKPIDIVCAFDDFGGDKLHDNFEGMTLSLDDQIIRLNLKKDYVVEIPVPDLNLENLTYRNFDNE